MAYVHWAGDHRDTIVVLTRDKNPGLHSNSHVWISKDYGHSFVNRTSSFMVSDFSNAYALINMFHASPVDNTKVSEPDNEVIICSVGKQVLNCIELNIHYLNMVNLASFGE